MGNICSSLRWEFTAPLPKPYNPPQRVMTYNDDNRLATFKGPSMGSAQNVTHDEDGNLTYGPLTNGQFTSLAYDARNRLIAVGGTGSTPALGYRYDPAGNRIGLTNAGVVTRFVVDPNTALSRVLMRIRPGVTNYYVYGLGLLYEITETATNSYQRYYHYDYRSSTVALTDGNGNATDRIEYSAYGTTTYRTGTTDTPFLFNGRYGVQTDPNGLLYMRARHYNPYLRRFINPDPIGFAGGLNWYAYADGNPINYLDPFGLGAVGENGDTSWLRLGWSAVANTVSSGIQHLYNVLYTGQWNPEPGVYEAAVEAAGEYVYEYGGVRGFYGGVGISGKKPGYGAPAGQAGLTATWTIDSGLGVELDVGAGLQERGRNSLGVFTSQTIGVGGSYQFYSQDTGLQLPSSSNVQFPAIYGGTANRAGGAHFATPVNANPVALGINYGAGYGGILIDPSGVLQNFVDLYHVITGTPSPRF